MSQLLAADSEQQGRRFEFGKNWSRFAADLPAERIEAARRSLAEMLDRDSLTGLSFLDIGSGSGLFSLAAATMGADRIHSLDFDRDSVETTRSLRGRLDRKADWQIERASVLDRAQMDALGEWDVVYAWGVLHHTGDMWQALEHTCARVRPGGRLFISIYNDQGSRSRWWSRVKRGYNRLPRLLRVPYAIAVMLPRELRSLAAAIIKGHVRAYLQWARAGEHERGMSRWHDILDWVGGYPFEVASPEDVFDFCAARGFQLKRLRTVGGGLGCNQFVFERRQERSAQAS